MVILVFENELNTYFVHGESVFVECLISYESQQFEGTTIFFLSDVKNYIQYCMHANVSTDVWEKLYSLHRTPFYAICAIYVRKITWMHGIKSKSSLFSAKINSAAGAATPRKYSATVWK